MIQRIAGWKRPSEKEKNKQVGGILGKDFFFLCLDVVVIMPPISSNTQFKHIS